MHRPDSGDRRHAHAGAPGQELLCRSSIGPARSSELATLSRQFSGAILVVERRVAENTSAPSCARARCISPAYSGRWALINQTGDIAR